MSPPCVHVIGAGVAGLACAVRLARQGRAVRLYDSAPRAGGRCRSYHDPQLDRMIDNGNHLILSGNGAIAEYCAEIGASDAFEIGSPASFGFYDHHSGRRWRVRPNKGPLPMWVLDRKRRPADTTLSDFASALGLPFAGADKTVADVVPTSGPVYTHFWEPLTLAALNTTAKIGQARLLWVVLAKTFLRGEAYCRPMVAREGLGPALVDPAINQLQAQGVPILLNTRVRAIERTADVATALACADGERITLGPDDQIVLAVPPARATALLPDLTAPGDGEPIVNVHFRTATPAPKPEGAPFLGLIHTRTHWAFVRDDVVSVTISAGAKAGAEDRAALTETVWAEVKAALNLTDDAPVASRVVVEKRATFDQSPAGVARRPKPVTPLRNLFLAGDWTDTGLPATLESATLSGHRAANTAMERLRRG
ncbi:MAG: hydroxysqualene dehydroxylase HpnE [Maricaulaceae bacterium]